MYCPKCGTAVAEDQKFCRSCGLTLVIVAQIVAGHPPAPESDQALVNILEKLRNRRKKLMRLGGVMMMAGVVAWGLIFKFIPGGIDDPIIAFLYLLFCLLIGLFLFAGGLFLLAGTVLIAPNALEPAKTAATTKEKIFTQLPPAHHHESISSIVENTTQALDRSLSIQPDIHE